MFTCYIIAEDLENKSGNNFKNKFISCLLNTKRVQNTYLVTNSKVNQMMQTVSSMKNGSFMWGISSSIIANDLFLSLSKSTTLNRLKFGIVSIQNTQILVIMTVIDIMATARAHLDVSGYSNKSQILRCNSLVGRIRSSSLTKPINKQKWIISCHSNISSKSHKALVSLYFTLLEIRA